MFGGVNAVHIRRDNRPQRGLGTANAAKASDISAVVGGFKLSPAERGRRRLHGNDWGGCCWLRRCGLRNGWPRDKCFVFFPDGPGKHEARNQAQVQDQRDFKRCLHAGLLRKTC